MERKRSLEELRLRGSRKRGGRMMVGRFPREERAMSEDRHSVEAIQADGATAAKMSATCPVCERDGRKVVAQHWQATRSRPCQFLGFQGFCVDCQLSFGLETAQLTL